MYIILKKNNIILLFLFCTSLIFSQQYPEPYNAIKTLPLLEEGWFYDPNESYLTYFIEQLQPTVVIEVGTWLGLSTMAMAHRLRKGAHLYAVDTWLGSSEHKGDPLLRTLFQQFLSNVIHKQLTHVIVPIRMESLEAASALKVEPQLIYLDAAHDTESVYKDIIAWYPKLARGGIICGDDWTWNTVSKAVIEAARVLKIQYHGDNNFWYFDIKK